MPPTLAFLLTAAFIVFLFRRDVRERPEVTGSLWLPLLWFLIIGTRPVSQWLGLFGFSVPDASMAEGSPLDAAVYFALIIAGIAVLKRRQIDIHGVIRSNRLMVAFLVYCLVSVLWSDDPFVSVKRWIKILGHPVMALVLCSEPDPEEALVRLMKRCAYVLVPASILLIKYFPQWGRGFEVWSGQAHDTGVTTNKNDLGCDCLILGFFFVWQLLKVLSSEKGRARRNEIMLCLVFLVMIGWLLHAARSSTSTVSLLIAVAMMWFLGQSFVNRRLVGRYVAVAIMVILLAQETFGVFDYSLKFLGKDPTLTDRTLLWHELLQVKINPVFGTGFEDFWMGERLDQLWKAHWWHPVEAHNGYLETYLNLGLIGLALMVGLILSVFRKGSRMLITNHDFARFRLGFLAAFVLYNWTEAAFKALHPVWYVFYLIAMDYPKSQFEPGEKISTNEAFAEDEESAYFEETILP